MEKVYKEITKRFWTPLSEAERRYHAPKDPTAWAIGRANEQCFVRFMNKRIGMFCCTLDTNGLWADVEWKVDACVMRADDIEVLYQVKSSRSAAEKARAELDSVLYTYHGIAFRIIVVYPDDDGNWEFLK